MSRKVPLLATAIAVALVVLIFDASGGAGWGAPSARAIYATHLDRAADAPLYDVLASVAALVPAGEPGFRLALLGAVLGALTIGGVVAAARVMLPRDPIAALAAGALLLLSPAFRDAVSRASPDALAACGTMWALVTCMRPEQHVSRAFVCCFAVAGSAPWLGAALTVIVAAWLARAGVSRGKLALGLLVLAAVAVILWFDATGSVPRPHVDLANVVTAGRGAGAVAIGAGLLGLAFAVLTGLDGARGPAGIATLAITHEIVVGGTPAVVLATIAVGIAVIPAAIVRAVRGRRRHIVALASSAPLFLAAVLTGPALRAEDPGNEPARLAHTIVGALPSGPGVIIATNPSSALAIAYERRIAGLRPDLAFEPVSDRSEEVAVNAMRAKLVVGSDVPAFARLDIRRAIPRGRGFQLVLDLPDHAQPVAPPARYRSAVGKRLALVLAIDRARLEAASGRLDLAARAAGQAERFGAANLALLALTTPSRERPLLFDLLPIPAASVGPWVLDLFGDDLAWAAGIPVGSPLSDAPMPARLHALWREIISGKARPEDAAALGPDAVAATKAMLDAVGSARK